MSSLHKVLITDDVHTVLIEGLNALDFQVDYMPSMSYGEVKNIASTYTGMIVNSKIIMDAQFLDRCTQLKFVGRLGSGMEIFDIPYATQNGITIFNSPEGNRNAVAEHTLAMLLALNNNLIKADREVRNFEWRREENRGIELDSKNIGIIGFGNTGSAFAKKLLGFDVKIYTYDKYLGKGYGIDFQKVIESDLELIFEKCDIISFHVPLSSETKNYFDTEFLEKCKKKVIIINTSRGNVINTKDLILGLESKKIQGACLDVFENEKTETLKASEIKLYKELYNYDNVVLSPHIAGWTQESKFKMATVLLDKIKTFLNLQNTNAHV
jgi:D-3-phosphoglycerate dehydrogenase / 2-oxoglutarate reductase